MAKDSVFRGETWEGEPFRFNKAVTEVFPDMLRRSVPGYEASLEAIGSLAARYVAADTRCYDLGCSLGAATLAMRQGIRSAGTHITAVDNSEAMIERCRDIIAVETAAHPEQPTVDVVYRDIWTDEAAAGRQADPDITLSYGDLLTPRPVSPACEQTWTASCRTVVHYEDHIHPLWSLPRETTDMNGNVISDFTCISCHSDRDAQNQLRVPLAQLDLSDGLAPNVQDQLEAFRELLFGDVELELNMGALQPRLVQVGTDPVTGDPILDTVPVAPSMSGAGANASQRFFSRFAPGGTHAGYLSDAELRLLSEWLDIGAQYYNDPFRVPQN